MKPIKVLYVVNKKLPAGDYRLRYNEHSQVCTIIYALPCKPEILHEHSYVQIRFEEGFRLRYIIEFGRLLSYLVHHKREFALVHFFSTNLILLGPIIAAIAGVPSCITVTGLGRTFTSRSLRFQALRPIYMLFMTIAVHLVRGVLFQNYADLDVFKRRFPWSASKFFYVGSAVSMISVQGKCFSDRCLRIILIARLMPDKGITDFLAVAEQLCSEKHFEFLLIGPASTGFEALQHTVQAYHARKIITYQGELDASATFEQLAQAHILFFPSYGEGMARVMLEAGFTKTCPICYDIAANRELIETGRGFIIPRGNIDMAVATIKYLERNREMLERNATAFQQYIIENFNIEAYSSRMDAIMTKITQQT